MRSRWPPTWSEVVTFVVQGVTDLALNLLISINWPIFAAAVCGITNVVLNVNPTGPTACRWCRERGPMRRLPPRRQAGKGCGVKQWRGSGLHF